MRPASGQQRTLHSDLAPLKMYDVVVKGRSGSSASNEYATAASNCSVQLCFALRSSDLAQLVFVLVSVLRGMLVVCFRFFRHIQGARVRRSCDAQSFRPKTSIIQTFI